MPFFHSRNRTRSEETQRVYALYELIYTLVDFAAAISFLVGSILFFYARFETAAIWLFVIGSTFFCFKPSIRLLREIRLLSMGETENLAKRYRD